MKQVYHFIYIAIFSFAFSLQAQTLIEISPHAGYLLNGKIQFFEGVLDVENDASFGISIGTNSSSLVDFELDYTWQPGAFLKFSAYSGIGIDDFTSAGSIHNISINSVNKYAVNEQFFPFVTLGMGLAIFDFKGLDTRTLMSLNLGAGVKYFINDKIGIRAQARMIAPIHLEGGGFYFGIGSGGTNSGLSLDSTVPLLEGDFSGGIILLLGN